MIRYKYPIRHKIKEVGRRVIKPFRDLIHIQDEPEADYILEKTAKRVRGPNSYLRPKTERGSLPILPHSRKSHNLR